MTYDDLLYTCCRCNAAKRDLTDVLNPAEVTLAEHLEVLENGAIRGLTEDGWNVIYVCQLSRPNLQRFRHGIFDLLRAIEVLSDDPRRRILRRYFGFPSNLPRLSTLRPPDGNLRPEGIAASFYEQRIRQELPALY
jgi:hypothetical protein